MSANVRDTLLDEQGRLYLVTDLGIGVVHSQDVLLAADAIDAGVWLPPRGCQAAALPALYGFVPSPDAARRRASASSASR